MREREDRQPDRAASPDYLRVIRARAWVIVLVVVIVVGATLVLSLSSTTMYSATSQLEFKPNALDQILFGVQVYPDSNQPRDVETAGKLVKVQQVVDAVKQQLGLPIGTGELLSMVDVTTSSADNLLQITVTSTDPRMAAQIANAFADQFVLFRMNTDKATVAVAKDLYKKQLDGLSAEEATSDSARSLRDKYAQLQILEATQNGGFKVVQEAQTPSVPVSPQPVRNGLLGLGVGLVLGLGLAFVLEHADKRIRDVKTIERTAGVPVLAMVPNVAGRFGRIFKGRTAKRCVGFAQNPVLLESFRMLRSSMKYFDVADDAKRIKTIMVTSGQSGEGKTVTAINLALSLTIAGHRVLLIDADLRHPKVCTHLGVKATAGLSTVLAEDASFVDVLQPVNVPAFVSGEILNRVGPPADGAPTTALFCLCSGPLPPNPAEVLGSSRMEALLRELEADDMVDYVVIDTAPVLSVADALVIAPRVDAVLMVARVNKVTKEELQQVREQLDRAGARVIGMVVGGVKIKASPYHKQTYQMSYR
jgi:succinoglycan biosynthesis transport protein ExoP